MVLAGSEGRPYLKFLRLLLPDLADIKSAFYDELTLLPTFASDNYFSGSL